MRWWWLSPVFGLLLYFWPVTYRLSVSLGGGRREVALRVTGLMGQVHVRGVQRPTGQDDLAVELRLFHVIRIRKLWPSLAVGWNRTGPYRQRFEDREPGVPDAGPGEGSPGRLTFREIAARWVRWKPVLRALQSGSRFWWRHLQVSQTHLHVRFGLEDAAQTALACGLAWSILGTALGYAQRTLHFVRRPEINLTPVYGRRLLQLELDSVARMRQGEATLAFLLSAAAYVKEKLASIAGRAAPVARPDKA